MSIEKYIIKADKWWEAQRAAVELQRKYGVSVDPAMFLTVPDPVAIVAGLNRQLFTVAGLDQFISRPIGFKTHNSHLEIKYPNGVRAFVKVQGNTPEERLQWAVKVMRSWHRVVLNGFKWKVAEVIDMAADTAAAMSVVSEVGTKRALAMALMLKDSVIDSYWHRAIALVVRGHVIELSQPGSGKTTYAWYMSRVLGGTVINESPTVAYLVGDMRDGSFGVTFTSNVLLFDEIDKWHGERLKEVYDVMLSGMENCTWSRAAGRGLNVGKCVSVVMLGNTRPDEKSRTAVIRLLNKLLNVNAQPLVDRVAYIALEAPRFSMDYVGDMLMPSVVRGISEVMTEEAHELHKTYRQKTDARTAWNLAVLHTVLRWVKESEPTEDEVKAAYLML